MLVHAKLFLVLTQISVFLQLKLQQSRTYYCTTASKTTILNDRNLTVGNFSKKKTNMEVKDDNNEFNTEIFHRRGF